MRTKEQQWSDAKSLLKKLNKYTGSGLYMLKHGSDDADDGLMLRLAQEMIKGIQTMTTVEVCKMDEDDAGITPDTSATLPNQESSDPDPFDHEPNISSDDIRRRYIESHNAPNKDIFDFDALMINYLNKKLENNEREGITIDQIEFQRKFPFRSIDEIRDSLIRLVYGLYVDKNMNPMIAVSGFVNVSNKQPLDLYYFSVVSLEYFKKNAQNKSFHGAAVW